MGVEKILPGKVEAAKASAKEERGDEEQLAGALAAIARGDTAALADVWELMARELYALALWRSGSREDAADVVQDVFVKLAKLGPGLARVARPRSYLLAMAHRAAVDRRRRRRPTVSLDEAFLLPADGQPAAEGCRLNLALSALPAAQREAVFLRHWGDLSWREIAAVTGVPTFTAASRYRLAIGRLRAMLGVEP